MTLLAELKIPQMFTAYAEELGYLDNNGLHHYQYFCSKCEQIFASAWGRLNHSMQCYERGRIFLCPHCGKVHCKNITYIKRDEPAPDKVRLVVKEYKKSVNFEIYNTTLKFDNYLGLFHESYKEVFKFDIAKQTVSFSKYHYNTKESTIELGNPFEMQIFNKSFLRYFRSNSLANSEQRSELSKILKVLREAVRSKLEKKLGHKISSTFVSSGQMHGAFLFPLFNMAYRVLCPDAPNLPSEYREEDDRSIRHFWDRKMIKSVDYMGVVIVQTRKKIDIVSALITAHYDSLPDKPLVRRILTEDPFAIKMLEKSFEICANYDYAIQLFYGFQELDWEYHDGLYSLLDAVKKLYGEDGLIRLVSKPKELNLRDCARLYNQLDNKNKKDLQTEDVKLRDLHDWMSLRHKKQSHTNIKFSVPDHIVKRLSMQRDRLKFFLPKESMQLLEAGHQLNNCVGSYGINMKDNKLWIVLVADDNGKLAACLEIKGRDLVQAKMDKNKNVSCDTKLNSEILDWAKEANIRIKTPDIKVPSKKKDKIKVSA